MGQAAHVTTSSANLDVIIPSPEPTPARKLSTLDIYSVLISSDLKQKGNLDIYLQQSTSKY